jgi:hypothetical protein
LECSAAEQELAQLGPASAAAILEVLDQPAIVGIHDIPSKLTQTEDAYYPALLRSLAATGREELVPILLRAVERLAAREPVTDPRIQSFARQVDSRIGFRVALSMLTYITDTDAQLVQTGHIGNILDRPPAPG